MTAIRYEEARGNFAGTRRRPVRRWASAAARRLFAMSSEWRRRARDRAELAALDDRTLADIGITRAEADFLGNKPFWKE